jgi:hypothetical protein
MRGIPRCPKQPTPFRAHQPPGGTVTSADPQRLARATSEMPRVFARVRMGCDRTCSWSSSRVMTDNPSSELSHAKACYLGGRIHLLATRPSHPGPCNGFANDEEGVTRASSHRISECHLAKKYDSSHDEHHVINLSGLRRRASSRPPVNQRRQVPNTDRSAELRGSDRPQSARENVSTSGSNGPTAHRA